MSSESASGSGSAAGSGWAGPGSSRVDLDVVFPLPPFVSAPGLSEKRRAAGRSLRRRLADINSAIVSLNWFAGYREPDAAPRQGVPPSAIQAEVTARVIELVDYMHSIDVAIPSPRSAFLELTRGRSVYDDKAAGANIARFSSAAGVSLPETVLGAPFLDEVIPAWMQIFFENSMERMLRSKHGLDGVKLVEPHWDARLKGCRRTYIRFVRALIKKGMIVILPGGSAKERVGVFFVKKTGKTS